MIAEAVDWVIGSACRLWKIYCCNATRFCVGDPA